MTPNTWFTSDTHLGHEKLLTLEPRPFSTIEEHDETIIENWNKEVKRGDEVWHIGDFAVCNKKYSAAEYLKRLNGNIHLIWGNHDDRGKMSAWACRKNFASTHDMHLYKSPNNEHIVLNHYSMRTWRNSHHDYWHLYGHSHGQIPNWGASLDVSTNIWNFKPVNLEEIRVIMKNRAPVSHHPVITEWHKSFPELGRLRDLQGSVNLLSAFARFCKIDDDKVYQYLKLNQSEIATERARMTKDVQTAENEEYENSGGSQ